MGYGRFWVTMLVILNMDVFDDFTRMEDAEGRSDNF